MRTRPDTRRAGSRISGSAPGPASRRPGPVRLALGVLAAGLLTAGLVAGCAKEPEQKPGADLNNVGPKISPGLGAPSSGPAPVESTAPPSSGPPVDPSKASASAAVDALRTEMATALAANPIAARTVTLAVRPSADNQLQVTWTVSDNADDTAAKTRLREDAIKILKVAKPAIAPYGSVLLVSEATTRGAGGKTSAGQVLRVKYTAGLIKKTDFTKVTPAQILGIADDKVPEIHPSFR